MTLKGASASDPQHRVDDSTKHPRGLFTLSGTELWERLSFYGLQVILAYYIYYSVAEGGLGMNQSRALAIAGAYGGAVYLVQPIGAWLADRVLPSRYVVLISCCLITSGHLVLAIVQQLTGLLLGLGLIIIGTGGLIPNVYAMTGRLYDNRAMNRDSGFSIFYSAIMVGAGVGPIVTGLLQVQIGFHIAFSAAGVGMAAGLAIYVLGWNTLPDSAKKVPNPLGGYGKIVAGLVVPLFAAVVFVLVETSTLTLGNINNVILIGIVAASIGYFVVLLRSNSTSTYEKPRVVAFIPIFVTGVVFWTLILQLFTTFAVYADTRVDMSIGPVDVPPAYISIFEVAAGVIAGPIIARGWRKLGSRQPRTVDKLLIGLAIMAIAYMVFAIIPIWDHGSVPLIPVIIGMAILGVAEVAIAPYCISAASQLAPRAFSSQMMALWGLTTAAGASLSGAVGQLYDASHESFFFAAMAMSSVLIAAMLFLCRSWLSRRGGLE